MATIFEYALLAGASYYDSRAEINRFPLPTGWTVYSRIPASSTTGFEATAFQNGSEIVISYAGTDFGLNPDLLTDAELVLGLWSAQLGEAAAYYLEVKAANPPGTIFSFTGHSLGGGLAALMSVFFGDTAAQTFDQAPFAASASAVMRYELVTYLTQHGYTQQQLAALAPAAVAQGKLIPSTYVKIVQPAESGVLREILVGDGQEVKAGQVLMRMDTDVSDAEQSTVETDLALRRLQLRRIDAELANLPFHATKKERSDLYAQAAAQYRANREAYRSQMESEQALLAKAN